MLAHVAFWDEAAVPVITYMLRGQPVPEGWRFGSGYVSTAEWPAADAHNTREAGWAREQPPAAVLERLDAAHAAKVQALATVTDGEVAANARYFGDLPKHYEEHLAELEGMLDAR